MAPEIISGKGYTKNVDLWSIGIMLFEFICGQLPYGNEEVDAYQVYN